MPRKLAILIAAVLLLSLQLSAATDLFGPSGVRPQAVRQGSLGSCYFHSAIAAIAATDPAAVQRAIQTVNASSWKVHFADGKNESVYLSDVQYTRASGFDRSEGLWVPILFRAYAQRTMRETLLEAVAASDFPAIVKSTGSSIFSNSDLLLLVYDRAVRSAINQQGDINRKQLANNLDQEMAAVKVSPSTRKTVLNMLDSKGYFDAFAAKIKANGEMFGAYRAVGQGGLPERVLAAFTGKANGLNVGSGNDIVSTLTRAQRSHLAMTASTGSGSIKGGGNWYVDSHAYTILSFDPDRETVTLRNPWGDHPDPEGVFTIPLETFVSAYDRIAFSDH
ncbi:MAG TPA: C2 family cysteine protease [Candidatus Angelobacter sp.]